jgi:hypothetical protein
MLAGRSAARAPRLEAVDGVEAVRALLGNAAPPWMADTEARAAELRGIAGLVAAARVARLVVPDDPATLPEIAAVIRDATGG